MSNSCCRCWITCGAVLMGLGVIAGALAAHGLDERLAAVHRSSPPVDRLAGSISAPAKALDDFRTAVRYHVWHALGMIAVGLAGSLGLSRKPEGLFGESKVARGKLIRFTQKTTVGVSKNFF